METGFLVKVNERRWCSADPPSIRRMGSIVRVTTGSGFEAVANLFPTTPEGELETQPVLTERTILFYEGRIDNRNQIAFALGRPGLAGKPDGELLAQAYSHWGYALSSVVLGEYSFVLVDRADGSLVAGRDSLGVRKIFFAETSVDLWVSSSLSLLLSGLPQTPGLDQDGLAQYFHLGGLGPDRTMFAGVRQVDPGNVLVQTRAGSSQRPSWRPKLDRDIQFAREGDYSDALRALLFEAVGAAMRSSGPLCAELSGGLDSSTVSSIAARVADRDGSHSRRLLVYSLTASKTVKADESAFQNSVVEACHLDHRALDVDLSPHFGPYEGELPSEPRLHIVMPVVHRALRDFMVTHNVRTCLTGDGGDGVFCGGRPPPWFLHEWFRCFRWVTWSRSLRDHLRVGRQSLWSLLRMSARLDMPEAHKAPGWMTPSFSERLEQYARGSLMSQVATAARPARALQFAIVQRAACWCRPKLSWDERCPLLYRPLVEFMLQIPWEWKLLPDQDRVVLRAAMKGILPEDVRLRTDKGQAETAFLHGLRINWSAVKNLSYGSRIAELGIVEPKRFERACVLMRHGHISLHSNFNTLISALALEQWLALGGLQRISELRRQYTAEMDPLRRADGAYGSSRLGGIATEPS